LLLDPLHARFARSRIVDDDRSSQNVVEIWQEQSGAGMRSMFMNTGKTILSLFAPAPQ